MNARKDVNLSSSHIVEEPFMLEVDKKQLQVEEVNINLKGDETFSIR